MAALLRRWGDVTVEGDWVTVRGVDSDAVADIVAALVARGGRVRAVEPQRVSLEDRFLQLLQDGDHTMAS
jgi:predicted naringenin-chalcone synthase